jgi:UDP-N-acetylmuramoyl-tripeptide--D-alanyl-D-alanine ligase
MKSILKKIISIIITAEAKLVLRKYKPKIVAVTGNIGKTSTKDAIFSVMVREFYTRKSEKSFNSDIGVPLTILGRQNGWLNPIVWMKNIIFGIELLAFNMKYPEWLILEVGADRPGDIQKIAEWLQPDIVIITAFAKVPVHVEYFRGREEVIREKKYLAEALKHDGTLIVNGDDDDAMRIREELQVKSLVYGTDEVADIVASDIKIYYESQKPAGMTFKVNYQENSIPVTMKGSLGKQNVYSSLAALAVGLTQKVNLVNAGEALLSHETPKGRMKIIPGIKDTIIIDDTYNSSPAAAANALETLKEIAHAKRKIAAFGDMLELGKHSSDEHYRIGMLAAESADVLVTVGVRARRFAEGALDAEMDENKIFQFDTSAEAGKFLQDFIKSGDTILIKGSQSMRMEKAVLEIMAEPQKAKELLVRQEEEWLKK